MPPLTQSTLLSLGQIRSDDYAVLTLWRKVPIDCHAWHRFGLYIQFSFIPHYKMELYHFCCELLKYYKGHMTPPFPAKISLSQAVQKGW